MRWLPARCYSVPRHRSKRRPSAATPSRCRTAYRSASRQSAWLQRGAWQGADMADALRNAIAIAAVWPWHAPHRAANQRGQALAEMALIVLILFTLGLGVVEFGRAWMVLSTITNVARDGARNAALTPSSGRNSVTKVINASTQTTISNSVHTQILNATGLNLPSPTVNGQADVGGVPMVSVTVTGTIPYLFGLFGSNFGLSRTVTFRDEGR